LSYLEKTVGHWTGGTLRKTFTVVGCLLFLFSFILPFFYLQWYGVQVSDGFVSGQNWSNYYSSYMTRATQFFFYSSGSRTLAQTVWFYNYWASNYVESTFDSASVFIPMMFIAQLLTLVLGLVSIKFKRKTLLLAPVLLSLLVVVLMTCVSALIQAGNIFFAGYQLGYYLVYPAIAMFLCAFLVNEATSARALARSNVLLILGIFLLAIGLVAASYFEMQYSHADVLSIPRRVYPYQTIGILVDAVGFTFMALGFVVNYLIHNSKK